MCGSAAALEECSIQSAISQAGGCAPQKKSRAKTFDSFSAQEPGLSIAQAGEKQNRLKS